MRGRRERRPRKALRVSWSVVVAVLTVPFLAQATPYDYISVGDPIESEIRVLDLMSSAPLQGRIRLPHLGIRPLQSIELQGIGRPPDSLGIAREISVARIERVLGRDRSPLFAPHPVYTSTPRLLSYGAESQSLEISTGIEGFGTIDEHDSHFASGSGFHGRIAVGLDRLLAYSHYIVGRIDKARTFTDPILPRNDLIVMTEETFLSYTEERGAWGVQFGENRWHWGPGEEGSLVLSKTSPALTGLAFHARIQPLAADAITLSATLKQAAGEQLAVHRLEWQPLDGLRIGLTEAARYRAPGWNALYLIGAIPYVIVERIERQNEPDSLRALRNNIITAFDAAWRIADGTRVYGELMLDDIHARSARTPNKVGLQMGWEGVGTISRARLTWGGEVTRISRFVYTSFFGRDHQIQGKSLGFPVAPDSRRIRIRAQADFGPDWQLGVRATHTKKGENDLSEPFRPPRPQVNSFSYEGVVETTREAEALVRWWPASGVILTATAGYRWVDDAGHVVGAKSRTPEGTLEVRLTR